MKHRFRSLMLVLLALASAHSRGDEPTTEAGQRLVAEAARRIAAEPAIAADLRYRVDAFGHELVGMGNYLQAGTGPDKRLRLELRMQMGDKLATLQEIRGDDLYWRRRDVPPAAPSLGRVDLRQMRKAIASAAAADDEPASVLPQTGWILLGGLPRLMATLSQNFAFEAPREDELTFHAADGKAVVRLPIWRVGGPWKPDRLALLVVREPGKTAPLPPQLPDRVDLVLGRTDEILPLFPYRITYWRTSPGRASEGPETNPPESAAPAAMRSLVTLEFFNVSRKGQIDPRAFEYQPGDQDVEELTAGYVQRYRSQTQLR